VTREQKLAVHLENVIFQDQPPGTRLSGPRLLLLIASATAEQKARAYRRALKRCPLLLGDERGKALNPWAEKPLPRQQCPRCGNLRRLAEGTVWCAKCLAWYRRELEVEWERENLGRQA